MKEGDIVTLVLEGAELDARVERVYDDQDYVDVRTLTGGAAGGIAYQAVLPKSKAGGDSIRHFETKSVAEQKAAERLERGEPEVVAAETKVGGALADAEAKKK